MNFFVPSNREKYESGLRRYLMKLNIALKITMESLATTEGRSNKN